MLPYRPEPDDRLAARFEAALAGVYDAESIRLGHVTRPGLRREHVFDTEAGVRLIVAREDNPGIGVHLHVSGSVQGPDTPLFRVLRRTRRTAGVGETWRQIDRACEAAFAAVSGGRYRLSFLVRTLSAVHWRADPVPAAVPHP